SETSILTAPDLRRVDLAGQPTAPGATARAFWSRAQGLVLTASRLPDLPRGRTYQLWVLTSGAPVSAGLFKGDASGGATAVFDTPVSLPAPQGLAVSIEPDGGVPAPTGAIILVGKTTE
ncbi:MAG TPA: anti-sigma factor, partial [Luteitalea sp.]|nr:anti-sigma factor [Luteitalea sp.]